MIVLSSDFTVDPGCTLFAFSFPFFCEKNRNGRFLKQDKDIEIYWHILTDEIEVYNEAKQAFREAKASNEPQKLTIQKNFK